MDDVTKLIVAVIGLLIGTFLLCRAWKKSSKIDTESIAIVKSIQDLGRTDGYKAYAIRYDVCSSEPFELLVTPCKKVKKIGTQRSVFYEASNPSSNYYFKTIGQFDSRLFVPGLLVAISAIIAVSTTISLLFS